MTAFERSVRQGPPRRLPGGAARALAAAAARLGRWSRAYPASALAGLGGWLVAGRAGDERVLAAGFRGREPAFAGALARGGGLGGTTRLAGGLALRFALADHAALAGLRAALPHLSPVPAGRRPSIGFGDRIGLATPGHLAAVAGSGLFPVLAQQSIREMTRTGRGPGDVMDDAVFGVLRTGWTRGFGADADHLKTAADVDRCAAAGFTLFTLDATDVIGAAERRGRTPAARWGRALALFAGLARRARAQARGPFELEVSLDELPFETSPADHRYVVTGLARRGVRVHQVAPRFTGVFEKGVDYRGDVAAFARHAAAHAAVARAAGGHKLSLHSGSDKFRVYAAFARATAGRFHLKTAGTSYLEALRVAARADPDLFREIAALARARFGRDRATYHVSARPGRVPDPARVPAAALERRFLRPDDARQVLHVTFGSVLGEPGLRDRLRGLLVREEGAHAAVLARHLGRHVRPLAR